MWKTVGYHQDDNNMYPLFLNGRTLEEAAEHHAAELRRYKKEKPSYPTFDLTKVEAIDTFVYFSSPPEKEPDFRYKLENRAPDEYVVIHQVKA